MITPICRFVVLVAFWGVTFSVREAEAFSASSSPLFGQRNVAGKSAAFQVATQRSTRMLLSPTLLANRSSNERDKNFRPLRKLSSDQFSRVLGNRIVWLKRKIRRSLALFLTISLFWFGDARLHSMPSNASPPPQATGTVRLVSSGMSASLDQMVDRYVKDHMFDEDVFDPVESAYREVHSDVTTGQYPQALQEVNEGTLGKELVKKVSGKQKETDGVVMTMVKKASGVFQSFGMSQIQSLIVTVFLALGGLFGSLLYIGISYSRLQKRGVDKITRARYGDDYNVSAQEKVEEDIEAPDDDEDEDDEDTDEDD